jgi:lipoate---protein ligase
MKTLDSGACKAEENMARDADLLKDLASLAKPLLHLYDWEGPSLTYGYFVKPEKLLNVESLKKRGIQAARRPTGGGVVFHLWDLAFSFLMPSHHPKFSLNPLQNYHFVNQAVLNAMEEYLKASSLELIPDHFPKVSSESEFFCMARPTKYDVVLNGVKIAGAAQRLTKAGYLHQGTISLASPDRALLEDVLNGDETLIQAMERYTFSPLGKAEKRDLLNARLSLKELLKKHLKEKCN